MSNQSSVFLIALLPPIDDPSASTLPRWCNVANLAYDGNSSITLLQGAHRFVSAIKEKGNASIVRSELAGVFSLGKSPSVVEEPTYIEFLLAKTFSAPRSKLWKLNSIGKASSSDIQDQGFAVVIDISDPEDPAYCFVRLSLHELGVGSSISQALPLSAIQYANEGNNTSFMSDEAAIAFLAIYRVLTREVLASVQDWRNCSFNDGEFLEGRSFDSNAVEEVPSPSKYIPVYSANQHNMAASSSLTLVPPQPNLEASTPSEIDLLTNVKSLWDDWHAYVACLLAIIVLTGNTAILTVNFRTIRFGRLIVHPPSVVNDHDVILTINIITKVMEISTTILSGWTLSQLWSRKLYVGAKLAGLHSLGLFSSVISLFQAFIHLFNGHFYPEANFYAILCVSGIVLQFYSTALVTLAIPTLVPIIDPPTDFSFVYVPFMSNPGIGSACADDGFGAIRAQACLGNMLVGNALTDIVAYDTANRPIGGYFANHYWMDVTTDYSPIGMQLRNPLGPLNGVDVTSGSVLFGENRGTIEGLIGYFGTPNSYIRDSTSFTVNVDTTTPMLTSQCVESANASAPVSVIAIANSTYLVPTGVPLLEDGFAMGQVTMDNNTMILSFRATNRTSNIHCAINLALRSGKLSITLDSTITQSFPNEAPWSWGDLALIFSQNQVPIAPFANLWLLGMGWSDQPARNSMSKYFSASNLSVGTGQPENLNLPGLPYTEHYTLAMLASGVGLGFAQERIKDKNSSSIIATRSYQVTKTQYFIGIRSASQKALVGIIVFTSMFVLWCLNSILQGEAWLLNWADSATLMCTAVSSPPIADFRRSRDGTVKPEAWKSGIVLRLYEGHLTFARQEDRGPMRPQKSAVGDEDIEEQPFVSPDTHALEDLKTQEDYDAAEVKSLR